MTLICDCDWELNTHFSSSELSSSSKSSVPAPCLSALACEEIKSSPSSSSPSREILADRFGPPPPSSKIEAAEEIKFASDHEDLALFIHMDVSKPKSVGILPTQGKQPNRNINTVYVAPTHRCLQVAGP